jgi:tetrahydromethanopterin S-methyltransferase subunit G
MSVTLEDAQKRIEEIPNMITKLNSEYNQLLGYIEGLKVSEEKKDDKKKKE